MSNNLFTNAEKLYFYALSEAVNFCFKKKKCTITLSFIKIQMANMLIKSQVPFYITAHKVVKLYIRKRKSGIAINFLL